MNKHSRERKRILRISTVPLSLKTFCKDLLLEIGDEYDVLAVSSPDKELDELQQAGIATAPVPMMRQISPLNDMKSLWRLIRLFRRYRPHMVHSITPKAGLLAMTAAWITRVPVRVHSFTGLVFPTATGLKKRLLMATDRATCAFATHILPEGEGVKDDLHRHGITSKQLRVLGYGNVRGVDMDHYDITPQVAEAAAALRRDFGIDRDAHFTFVFVGRIVGDKGINELIESFAKLHEQTPYTHLVMVGNEEPDDPVAEHTRQIMHTHPAIHLSRGWIDDVRPYYAIADALVFPSYREGFPNVVLEAGALSLPAVVTDINGSREIIRHGYNGLIVPPRDAQSLHEAMTRLANDREYTRRLAAPARHHIATRYDARFVRKCLKDFYNEVL